MELPDHQERDKLYWYIHTFLWGRYAGSTESKLNQDSVIPSGPAHSAAPAAGGSACIPMTSWAGAAERVSIP